MGRYLTAFFQRIGATNTTWYVAARKIIMEAASRVRAPSGLGIGGTIDWLLACAIGAYIWQRQHLTEDEKDRLEAKIRTAPDVIYNWLELSTGVRPQAITRVGLLDWAGRVAALNINTELGTSLVTLHRPQDFDALLLGLQDELLAELVGSDNAKYSLMDEGAAHKIQRQIANVVNRAKGLPGLGGFTQLPVTRERMLGKLRQQRWRKKHNPMYENYLYDPVIDATLVRMWQDIDAVKRGQYVP